MMEPLVDGIFTVSDEHLYAMVAIIRDSEGLALEPSAVAGAAGIAWSQTPSVVDALAPIDPLHQATHLIWATGGNMVPGEEMQAYYERGVAALGSADRVLKPNS